MIALETTHVTPLRRAAAKAALARCWKPGDAVVVRWFTPPTDEELADDDLLEGCESVDPGGRQAFVVGFVLWLDTRLDAEAVGHAVYLALRHARRRIN